MTHLPECYPHNESKGKMLKKMGKKKTDMHPEMGYANFLNYQGPSLSINDFEVK